MRDAGYLAPNIYAASSPLRKRRRMGFAQEGCRIAKTEVEVDSGPLDMTALQVPGIHGTVQAIEVNAPFGLIAAHLVGSDGKDNPSIERCSLPQPIVRNQYLTCRIMVEPKLPAEKRIARLTIWFWPAPEK